MSIYKIAFLFIVLGAISLYEQSALAQTKISLCEDPWPPYTIGKMGEAPAGGIAVQINQALYERIPEIELTMILMPWKRCLKEVERGTKDGFIIALKSPLRPYVGYADSIFDNPISFFYRKAKFPNGFDWKKLEDFIPYRIGMLDGSVGGEEFDKMEKDNILNIERSKNVGINFRKLMADRVDFVFSNEIVGFYTAQKMGVLDQVAATRPLQMFKYYSPISHKSPLKQFIPQINQALQTMKQEGVIDAILKGKK